MKLMLLCVFHLFLEEKKTSKNEQNNFLYFEAFSSCCEFERGEKMLQLEIYKNPNNCHKQNNRTRSICAKCISDSKVAKKQEIGGKSFILTLQSMFLRRGSQIVCRCACESCQGAIYTSG